MFCCLHEMYDLLQSLYSGFYYLSLSKNIDWLIDWSINSNYKRMMYLLPFSIYLRT